jgi:hypothetical protein
MNIPNIEKMSNHNFIAETCFLEAGPSIGTGQLSISVMVVPFLTYSPPKIWRYQKKHAKNKKNMPIDSFLVAESESTKI